jgi:predicted DsbA family dithiol-disulfide isomerase
MATTPAPLQVDVWSDVVCPWCYIGKRRFERAVTELDGELEIEVRYHAFQLDPTAPPGVSEPVVEAYAKKFGGSERAEAMIERVTSVAAEDGIDFRMDRARRANTLLAHRLIWLAGQAASPIEQADMKERLMRAYFHDGLDIGDPDVMVDCAAELGFERSAVADFLDSTSGMAEVAADIERAGELGVTAVPTYVVNGMWAIPGAQDSNTFVTVLRRVRERMQLDAVAAAPACDDDIGDV